MNKKTKQFSPIGKKNAYTIPAATTIGHIHLKVADIDRSLAFYRDILGFEVMARDPLGRSAFISAGGYHHHIGLNTWQSKGGNPAHENSTGLYHFAIRYPSRKELAIALKRMLDAGINLDGASDHGISHALYFHDPDGNGIELEVDMPRKDWPTTPDGKLNIYAMKPLDIDKLLSEAGQ